MPLWWFCPAFFNGIFSLLEKMRVGLKTYLFDVSLQSGKGFYNFFDNLVLKKTELLAVGGMIGDDGEGFADIFQGQCMLCQVRAHDFFPLFNKA